MSWSRIFPNGNDVVPNQEGLKFYDKMISELEKYNIAPVVTLYAYDLPLNLLREYDGWMSRSCVEDYLKYVETVVNIFKGRVKYWVPFNEQNFLSFDSEYMTGYRAKDEFEIFRLEHHFAMAYSLATQLIHKIDSNAKVGGNVAMACLYPLTCNPRDVEASDELRYKMFYNYADVLFRKKYTGRYLKNLEEFNLDEVIREGDMKILSKAEPDFFSTTYYFSSGVNEEHMINEASMEALKAGNPYCKANEWGWSIDPYGLKHALHDIYHRYQMPIMILENGLGHRDVVEEDGSINDDYRIDYLKNHIIRMMEAIEEGVDVFAYLTWSATDLYSTREGFEKRYGFIHVDKDGNFKRQSSPKKCVNSLG